jgi:hypothetical protein
MALASGLTVTAAFTRTARPHKGGATRPAARCETGGNRTTDSTAKEGHTMNADIWLELLIIVLRIVSAGLAG